MRNDLLDALEKLAVRIRRPSPCLVIAAAAKRAHVPQLRLIKTEEKTSGTTEILH